MTNENGEVCQDNIKQFGVTAQVEKYVATSILVVSADFPYPVDTGKKVVLKGLLTYFIDRFGADNVTWLLIGSDHKENSKLIKPSELRMEYIPLPPLFRRLLSLFWYSFFLRTKSIQESLFYSPKTQLQIDQQIELARPDIVMFDTIRMGQFKSSHCTQKCFLYMDDLFSVRYKRMLEQMQQGRSFGTTVLGSFARFIPGIISHRINSNKLIQSLLLRFEQDLVAQSERVQPQAFQTSLLLNLDEVEDLIKVSGEANIQFMPPFLGIPENPQRNFDGHPQFVYLGSLKYPPNEIGLLEFFDKGLELAIKNIPEMEIIIVGKGASQRLIDAVDAWNGRVKLVGFVEDLSPLFSNCCCLLLPMVLGTGVKLKALEAMSRGVPMVSTQMGVDSIPVSHGKECFIENDLSKFWIWMEKLTHKECNRIVSEASLDCFKKCYSEEAVYRHYDSLFLDSIVNKHLNKEGN